ncbi:MAG: pyridoxamine 5'-phosphate oxidase family protein [Chthoniobacter sp.]
MNAPSSASEQTQHFLTLLKKLQNAMLVTHTGEHGFHARPMAIAQVEDDGRIWFFTSVDTAKVHEIEMDSQVHLVAQEGRTFLSLSGRASLIGDREKIAHLWREPFRVWFPGGKDDPDIELIAIRPERGEFWDNSGAQGLKYLWESAKAYVSGTTPDTEDGDIHGAVRL